MRRTSILFAAVLLLFTLSATADTTERLSTIARVWGAVKFTHPYLGYREDIDWDAAGVRAAERARGSEPLENIVAEMLGAMHDPMTRVVAECVETGTAMPPPEPYREYPGGVVYVPVGTLVTATLPPALADLLKRANHVIFDLRAHAGACTMPELAAMPAIEPLLIAEATALPAERKLRHRGYHSQDPELDPGYESSFFNTLRTIGGTAGANVNAKAIFITNERSVLPPLALALLKTQRARIVSVGRFGEEAAVSHLQVALGNGWQAVIRTGELNVLGNGFTTGATVTVPADGDAIKAAVELTRPASRRRSSTAPANPRRLADYVFRYDERYPDMKYPDFGYRALAAFRLWNVIHYFYAYKPLIGDWDARLPDVVNVLTNAASQAEYDLGIARVMTWVPDGHSQVFSPTFLGLRGPFGPPFALMPVEGRPVVVELIDAAASGAVALGDELLAVDGRPVSERYGELDPYVSGSHEAARTYYMTSALGNAATESDATFTFRKPGGVTYDAKIRRSVYARTAPEKAWRILPGNIGYIDLRWLENAQVDTAINELMSTKGLIIDIRNYPRGVFPRLGRRLNTAGLPSRVASLRVPLLTGGSVEWDAFIQEIGSTTAAKYTGKTVTLINERAQSQSEHTCLVLEALNNTTFVGSPTVGANGNISFTVLPGGIYVMFTGMDVRHLDGRQLQRIGIVPHVDVPRTIEAFRQGRDEVLEKAVALLQ
jgi:C-terminal processing protease CtpA/Prc